MRFNEESSVCREFRHSGIDGKEYNMDRANSEFEKYRIIQDGLYISDFDKLIGINHVDMETDELEVGEDSE